jgi:glycolate oxidase iron-sulfur subunit
MEEVNGTGAPTVVTANPGCILQLRAGGKLYGTGQQALHVVELLDRARGSAPSLIPRKAI